MIDFFVVIFFRVLYFFVIFFLLIRIPYLLVLLGIISGLGLYVVLYGEFFWGFISDYGAYSTG